MARKFLDIEEIPEGMEKKVRQDLKFRTGVFVWRVKFNIPLDPTSITESSMFVANTKGQRIESKIRYDAETFQIEVEPLVPYAQDEYYYLYITTSVRSKNGQKLSKPVQLKFKL